MLTGFSGVGKSHGINGGFPVGTMNVLVAARGMGKSFYWGSSYTDFLYMNKPAPKQKIGRKGKHGKPHWRTLRMLYMEDTPSILILWKNIKEEYWKSHPEIGVINQIYGKHTSDIINWVVEQTSGCRQVYDIVYDTSGIHFETVDDRIQFILTWT